MKKQKAENSEFYDEKGKIKTLTDEQKKIFLDSISNGMNVRDSAILSGVSAVTIYNHFKKDVNFFKQYKKAKIKNKAYFVNIINKAANKSWQAAAWMLERKYNAEYGLKQKITQENVNQSTSDIDYSKLTDDEIVLLKAILNKAGKKK